MKILSNLRVNSTGSFFIIFCLFEKNFNVDIYKSMWLYRNTCQIQNERETPEKIIVIILSLKDPHAFEELLLFYCCY